MIDEKTIRVIQEHPLTLILSLPDGCVGGRLEAAQVFAEHFSALKAQYPGEQFQLLPFLYEQLGEGGSGLKAILAIGRAASKVSDTNSPPAFPEEIIVGQLHLFPGHKQIAWKGQSVKVTPRQYDVVAVLAQAAGKDQSYRRMKDSIWGTGFLVGKGDEGYSRTISSLIKHIRKAFHAVDPEFDRIQVRHGFGFQWTPE